MTILYRGPLSSCNYDCHYCPFAKRRETAAQHAADGVALERFLGWVGGHCERSLSVFFTPWGEALVRRRYQRALVRLCGMAHVRRAVIQTNLSCRLDWTRECNERLALWCTYHPGETERASFLGKCLALHTEGVRFSVGVVGLKEHVAEIERLRAELPAGVYLWINAYKRVPDYYTAEEVAVLTGLDPLFGLNNQRHASLGQGCRTGHEVVSVDGDGVMRRCHFVAEPIGNLYSPSWESALRPRDCPAQSCGCHIGYVHLERLGADRIFGEGILERVYALPQSAS